MSKIKEEGYIPIIEKMYADISNNPYTFYNSIINGLIDMSDYSKKSNLQFNIVLIFIIILLLFSGYFIFFFNPYKILNYAQIPLIIIYLILLFYCIYYLTVINKKKIDTPYINLAYETNIFSFNYFKFFIFFILLFIIILTVFNITKQVIINSLDFSFFLTLFLLFIFIAFVDSIFNISNDNTITNNYIVFDFFKNIIFYIPCLIIDSINYLKNDYANTPSVSIILLIMLIIIFTIYINFVYNKIKVNKSGINLINKAAYLNTDIVILNKEKLNEKIIESKPFYERELYKIQIKKNNEKNLKKMYSDISTNEILEVISPIPYYADKLSRPKYREGFTSIISDETIPIHLSINEYDKYILQQLLWDNPDLNNKIKEKYDKENNEDIGLYIKNLISNNNNIISYYEKIMLYFSTKTNKDFTKNFINDLNGNNYHYSFSFWLYLIPNQSKNKKNVIYTYGNRPSMYYNSKNKELTLEYNSFDNEKETPVVVYKTNSILFQRWNNIVINNNYGVYDIFINGILMGTYKNIVNYKINTNELLKIGSSNNEDIGGISHFYYYENPLNLDEITKIYKNNPSF
jgi:hypothetical protein